MKRADFQGSEEFMASLNEILRTPVTRAAIEIVKNESVGLPDAQPGIDFQQHVAICGAYTAGVFRAFDKLESLARPVTFAPHTVPPQTQYAEQAKERMRSAGVYTDKEISDLGE